VGISSFGTSRTFFMLPLPIEVMVGGVVSLGASSSSKNLVSTK